MNIAKFECINVRDFGASGDGAALATAALQSAIDCGAKQGLPVVIHPGEYRCGTLHLRDNLVLELQKGARIIASENFDDYIADVTKSTAFQPRYLLWGNGVCNVKIFGEGAIDGSGRAFWEDSYISGRPASEPQPNVLTVYDVLKPKPNRPAMVYCENCRNLEISGITLQNSAAYTVWVIGCEEVSLTNLTLRTPLYGPNTDGLDIDSCRKVKVSNCDIITGDDCIAIKSDSARLGRKCPCENIVVENCRFTSTTCGIRIGYEGDCDIQNCSFRNIEIRDTRHGVDLQSIVPVGCTATKIVTGTPIHDILFENFKMTNVGKAFFVWAGNDPGQNTYSASIHDVEFRNIAASEVTGSYIGTVEGVAIRNIFFDGLELELTRPIEKSPKYDFQILSYDKEGVVPNNWGFGGKLHAALTLRGTANITFRETRITAPKGINDIVQY